MQHHNYEKIGERLNYIGMKFNKWTVLDLVVLKQSAHFVIQCDCGNKSRNYAYKVLNNTTKSCYSCANKKHGWYGTATHRSWSAAKNRCTNPNNHAYDNYGGRGNKMCDRWLESFENFLVDMGEKPQNLSLDRIDNDGNYEPNNCRWATKSQQNSNRRKSKKLKE